MTSRSEFHLGGDYYVRELDSYSWGVERRKAIQKGKNAGKEYSEYLGYSSTLPGALRVAARAVVDHPASYRDFGGVLEDIRGEYLGKVQEALTSLVKAQEEE